MAEMPRGQPRSVPDPLSDEWDRAAALNRRLLARNETTGPRFTTLEHRLRDADMSNADWQQLRSAQMRGETSAEKVAVADPARPPARRPDPSTTDVFRRGPDGKLHPVEGWHTTGPFAFGEWARNVDWPGVAGDLGDVAAGVAGFLLPPLLGPLEKAAAIGNFWNIGRETARDLEEADRKSGR